MVNVTEHDGAGRSRGVGGRALGRRARVAVLTVLVVGLVLPALVLGTAAGYLAWVRHDPVELGVGAPGVTVDAAGVPTRVEHWPAEHPRGLPPLVLVPGFAESTYVWSRVGPLLAADRDVYAYDVRGFGFSGRVPPYTLESDTDQLAGVIAALHLSRPVVVGHSSGVAVALSLALRSPDALSGVVAANGDGTPYFGGDRAPGGGARSWLVDPLATAAVTAVVRHRAPVRRIVASRCGPGCPVDDEAIDRWRAPFLRPGGVDALMAIVRQPLIGLTDAQEAAVAVPAAVVYGTEDDTFDRAAALATAGRLHTARVAELPGARHLAPLGDPGPFAAALGTVLAALPPR
jgi:pimeloyl-ACP methyl ester carboxylesterase